MDRIPHECMADCCCYPYPDGDRLYRNDYRLSHVIQVHNRRKTACGGIDKVM